MFGALVAGNVIAWAWALVVTRGDPALLGAAALAYVLGLRHAFDADHIAAIDNVTRSLSRRGSAPATVGLWFALGHSAVVVAACAAIALTLSRAPDWLRGFAVAGGVGGTLFSIVFLCAIAAINVAPIPRMLRAWRGEPRDTDDQDAGKAGPSGLLTRLLAGPLRAVRRPWHMLLVGFLFGLGFDTASEIGLLGLSAQAAAHTGARWSIMVLPALFTAGMSLADTADGVIMARAYGWALERPTRRAGYNLTITGVSVVAAIVVAALELGDLVRQQLALPGPVWLAIEWVDGHSGLVGCLIAAALIGCWAAAEAATWRRP